MPYFSGRNSACFVTQRVALWPDYDKVESGSLSFALLEGRGELSACSGGRGARSLPSKLLIASYFPHSRCPRPVAQLRDEVAHTDGPRRSVRAFPTRLS